MASPMPSAAPAPAARLLPRPRRHRHLPLPLRWPLILPQQCHSSTILNRDGDQDLRHRAMRNPGVARPPRRASSRRARLQSRALPAVASLRDGASATLDSDLSRQVHRHLSEGRERPSRYQPCTRAVPNSRCGRLVHELNSHRSRS